MGYLTIWKILEEMITDLRKRGAHIPSNVFNDLKCARTLINVLRADPSKLETNQKIEECLNNVEAYLISEGQRFGDEYVNDWLRKLEEASRRMDEDESVSRFVPGLPRGQLWVRIKPSDEMPLNMLKALAEELNLTSEEQSDGCLLVCGEERFVKEFVKKMATRYGLKVVK
ncbi:MAG: DUF2096 domain-containing protein [Candidatus Bathyarchaeota archaeon]|nr:DUF2096 domain-containing protein [Candidatus Bathyarchaeota archaeon]MDW8040807.1 DUF2096 family protein [Nitrososphaerota archaeon]